MAGGIMKALLCISLLTTLLTSCGDKTKDPEPEEMAGLHALTQEKAWSSALCLANDTPYVGPETMRRVFTFDETKVTIYSFLFNDSSCKKPRSLIIQEGSYRHKNLEGTNGTNKGLYY